MMRYPTHACRYCGVNTAAPRLIREPWATMEFSEFSCPKCYPYRAIEVLEAVDNGELTAEMSAVPIQPFLIVYDVAAPDGVWRFVVFDDSDSWDYIKEVVSPEGDKWTFADDAMREANACEEGLPGPWSGPIGMMVSWHPQHRERWPWPYIGGLKA